MAGEANIPGIAESAGHAQPHAERSRKGFWALIATQFQGAFSDNILRNLLLSMVVAMGVGRDQRETFVSAVTFIFSVPFLLFSMTGGWLADRFSKRTSTAMSAKRPVTPCKFRPCSVISWGCPARMAAGTT